MRGCGGQKLRSPIRAKGTPAVVAGGLVVDRSRTHGCTDVQRRFEGGSCRRAGGIAALWRAHARAESVGGVA